MLVGKRSVDVWPVRFLLRKTSICREAALYVDDPVPPLRFSRDPETAPNCPTWQVGTDAQWQSFASTNAPTITCPSSFFSVVLLGVVPWHQEY